MVCWWRCRNWGPFFSLICFLMSLHCVGHTGGAAGAVRWLPVEIRETWAHRRHQQTCDRGLWKEAGLQGNHEPFHSLCVCVCLCECVFNIHVCLLVPTEAVRAVLWHPSLLPQGDWGSELRKASLWSVLPCSLLWTGERQFIPARTHTHTGIVHTCGLFYHMHFHYISYK